MEIITAKTAGFCFGVKRAVDAVFEGVPGKRIVTLGPIIHNKNVIKEMLKKGIGVTETLDDATLLEDCVVFIRAQGIPPEIYRELREKNIDYRDCTCPCVAKIQSTVEEKYENGFKIIILGDKNHSEVVGLNGYTSYTAEIISNESETEAFLQKTTGSGGKYFLVSQTTFNSALFQTIVGELKKKLPEITIKNTICSATKERQTEAEELSRKVSAMIVIGDKNSSNSVKLYDICKKNIQKTYFVESIDEIVLNNFNIDDKIGITAGASTPPGIIREAIIRMNEFEEKLGGEKGGAEPEAEMTEIVQPVNENSPSSSVNADGEDFEKLLAQDGSLVHLHTGAIVKGIVISVVNGEVNVNLGFKSDGIIQKGEFCEDQSADPADFVRPGDEIDVFVIRVNDKEGNVLLSRRKIENQKGVVDIEAAAESGEPLPGKFKEVIKGGMIAMIKGWRAFVPSSQVSDRFVENLETLIGKEVNFQILQYDKAKKRIVAGRKELAAKEIQAAKEKIYTSIEPGQKISGTVTRVVDFGAFVDIGGIDGLIHVSELSWGRVKKASDVLKEGDSVVVTVLDIDQIKGKISLSLKDIALDPWNSINERFPEGTVVRGKVVRMVAFGAFVELAPGVDGLIHISQIAEGRVEKPSDVLAIGEEVDVFVEEIDLENKKVRLSKRKADNPVVEYYDDDEYDDYDDDYADDEPEEDFGDGTEE